MKTTSNVPLMSLEGRALKLALPEDPSPYQRDENPSFRGQRWSLISLFVAAPLISHTQWRRVFFENTTTNSYISVLQTQIVSPSPIQTINMDHFVFVLCICPVNTWNLQILVDHYWLCEESHSTASHLRPIQLHTTLHFFSFHNFQRPFCIEFILINWGLSHVSGSTKWKKVSDNRRLIGCGSFSLSWSLLHSFSANLQRQKNKIIHQFSVDCNITNTFTFW
jgi:hypothetical protein